MAGLRRQIQEISVDQEENHLEVQIEFQEKIKSLSQELKSLQTQLTEHKNFATKSKAEILACRTHIS